MIDCHGTNGNPTWAYTNSRIMVAATRTDGVSDIRWIAAVPSSKCATDDSFPIWVDINSQNNKLPVRSIEVYIDGTDQFFIDRVVVMNDLMTSELAHVGANNTSGWCLSTETETPNAYCGPAEVYHSFVLDPPVQCC
jgi:hypothetical protein